MSDKTPIRNNPDRRIRKTQDALGGALMALLHQHEWDAITIQMISDQADVARSSFYVHFPNKVELLDFCIAMGVSDIRQQRHATASGTTFHALSWLVDHVLIDRSFFLKLAQSTTGQIVFLRFKDAVQNILAEELAQKFPQASTDQTTYIICGSFGLIQRWLTCPGTTKATELKATLQTLAVQMLLIPQPLST